MIAHPFGIAGLVVSMLATVVLLRYPPEVRQYTEDGGERGDWASAPTVTGKRKYWIARSGYQLGIALLAFGFLLQLLDLLRA